MNLNIFTNKQKIKAVKLSLREKKHQVNLQNNSGLYFQIGLIATLFLVFGAFQFKFIEKEVAINKPVIEDDLLELSRMQSNYIIEENSTKVVKSKHKEVKSVTFENPVIVDDDDLVIQDFVMPEPAIVEFSPTVNEILVSDLPPVIDTFPVSLVSQYPEYPGCEKFEDKQLKFKCFQQKIAKHIQRNFDSDIAVENGISGIQKVLISFTINHEGVVVDVIARSPHPELQKEAIKAITSLPKMTPAKQAYKKVNVTYALPLIFKVE
jgi:protein TonB